MCSPCLDRPRAWARGRWLGELRQRLGVPWARALALPGALSCALSCALCALACTLAVLSAPGRAAASEPSPQQARDPALRVCVDPDNLPYSHADGRGIEPRIARILADALGRPLALQWQPMRRGTVRKTLDAGVCDVLVTVPEGLDRVLTTRAYYRSSYVFVNRAASPRPLQSFDDPRLATLRIGVQLVGDDGAASPPGHALARHGAVSHVVGYTVDGGSADDAGGPAAQRIVRALQRRELDAALVWGPQVGWFARQADPPLRLTPARPPADLALPFEFSMALAVRRGDRDLRDRLQDALHARKPEIDAVLDAYGVPRMESAGGAP